MSCGEVSKSALSLRGPFHGKVPGVGRWFVTSGLRALKKNVFLTAKVHVCLRFEQQRFYNPHHHPEMPRTLQSLDRRVGHGED
jgi:hypothetical protein